MRGSNTKPVINYNSTDPKTGAKYGDKRVVRKFLWFPKSLLNETRWLEFAYIEERYEESYSISYNLFGLYRKETLYNWVEKEFMYVGSK